VRVSLAAELGLAAGGTKCRSDERDATPARTVSDSRQPAVPADVTRQADREPELLVCR